VNSCFQRRIRERYIFIRLFLKGDLEDKSAGPTGEASLLRNYKINLKKWEVRGLGRAVVGKVTG
jgi:hypothetical protein